MAFKVAVHIIAISFIIYFQLVSVFGLLPKQTIKTEEDDLELDKEVAILNKPPIKTFKNRYGNTYDCVDIQNQPFLEHPLLRNQTMIPPNSSGEYLFSRANSPKDVQVYNIRVENECSIGTVLIQRTTKEDLIRAKSFFRQYTTLLPDGESYFFAGIQTKVDANKIYRGATALLSINKPHLYSNTEWSAATITVRNKDDYIIVGWMVNPELYGDQSTRLFTLWAADGNKTGCYNMRCSGFVQQNSSLPLDYVLDTNFVFAYGMFAVSQDKAGNWFLQFGPDNSTVGYWPKELFTHLNNGADYIRMGGEVYTSNNNYWPEMGKGGTMNKDYVTTANMIQILFGDNSYKAYIPDNSFIEVLSDRCYMATDASNKVNNRTLGYSFLYAGSGGAKDKCFGAK